MLPCAEKSSFKTGADFLKSLWGLGTEEEEGYRTGPPGYIGWRNSLLGIDSRAPYTFKNTGSVYSLFRAHADFHISFDKNWFSRFKTEITSSVLIFLNNLWRLGTE
jgi:hypothetical protein